MIYLILSVVASTLIFIAFKLFDYFKINTLQAIVFNYSVACLCGFIAYENPINIAQIPSYDWFYGAIGLGVLFIVIFNLMAITTQRSGLSVVSVATKMSVVVPILFGILYYSESLGIWKIIGILLALAAVYLSSIKNTTGIAVERKNIIFPILVFVGSGIIDTSIKFIEESYVAKTDVPLFSATLFASAFVIGIFIILYQIIMGTFKFEFKNLLGGIGLGVPNYFSIYFIVQALRSDGVESSTIFAINNVAIVMVSTVLGILFFKEKLITKNWIGIGLAVLSIMLVASSTSAL